MDSEKPHSRGSLATRMACTLIGLLLLYPVSYGPFCYLYGRSWIGDPRIHHIYDPLRSPLPLHLFELVLRSRPAAF